MKDCIFCKIVDGDIPCFKIYENERVLAFADINPIAKGHTLVIPKVHAENIIEMSREDLISVQVSAQKIASSIYDALEPKGIALLQLNGRGVGQEVMHYHLHVVPRMAGDPQLPITAWTVTPGDMDAVKATANRISSRLNSFL